MQDIWFLRCDSSRKEQLCLMKSQGQREDQLTFLAIWRQLASLWRATATKKKGAGQSKHHFPGFQSLASCKGPSRPSLVLNWAGPVSSLSRASLTSLREAEMASASHRSVTASLSITTLCIRSSLQLQKPKKFRKTILTRNYFTEVRQEVKILEKEQTLLRNLSHFSPFSSFCSSEA